MRDETKMEEYSKLAWIEIWNAKIESQILRNQQFFIFTTQKDFEKRFICQKNNNNHSHAQWTRTDQQHLHVYLSQVKV